MRRILLLKSLCITFVLVTAVSKSSASLITGAVTALGPQTIDIRVQGDDHSHYSPIPLRISFNPVVEIDDVNDGGLFERQCGINQLGIGDQVTVSIESGSVVRIRVRQKLGLQGMLQGIYDNAIDVQTRLGSSVMRLGIDRLHLRLTTSLFDRGPQLTLKADDLRRGMLVSVINARGRAYSIDVAPSPSLAGKIDVLTATELVVRETAPTDQKHTYSVGPQTCFFNNYFGERPESCTAADMKFGQLVNVTSANGRAIAVVANFPATFGRVTHIEGTRIFIGSGQGTSARALDPAYQVSAATKIYMGVARLTRPSPEGGTETVYDYLPGAKLDDIHIGDRVSITARRDIALSIRVTPTAKRPVAAVSAVPAK